MSVRNPSVRAPRSVQTPPGPTRAPAGPGTQHGPRVGSVLVCISVSPGFYTCSCRAGYTARSEGRVCVGMYLSLPRVLHMLLPGRVHSTVRGSGLCRYVSQSHPGPTRAPVGPGLVHMALLTPRSSYSGIIKIAVIKKFRVS